MFLICSSLHLSWIFFSNTFKVEGKNVFLLQERLSAGIPRKILDVKGQFAEM